MHNSYRNSKKESSPHQQPFETFDPESVANLRLKPI
jgi:hypothetical protein